MQHRRIVDAAFAKSGALPSPAVETNSVSTLVAHARSGLPGVTAHTWLAANPLPEGLRALPLVDPEVRYTIGIVTGDRRAARADRLRAARAVHAAGAGAGSGARGDTACVTM